MRRAFACLIALALLLAAAPAAAPSAGPVYVTAVEAEYPAHWFAPGSADRSRAGLPKVGTMRGTWDMATTDLTFDRVSWTMSGVKGPKQVRLTWDHDAGVIKGAVGGVMVSLKVEWTPERVRLVGAADGEVIDYTCDWTAKRIDGTAFGKTVALTFDLEKGNVDGLANGGLTKMVYSKKSGALNGLLGVDMANLKLENLDLYDFFMHLYIFLH